MKEYIVGILILGTFPGLAGCVKYSRPGEGLLTVPDDIPETTTELDLSSNRISALEPRWFAHLHVCEIIDISFNNLHYIQKYSLEGLQNLRVLNMSFNYLAVFSIETIERLSSLIVLDLSNNNLETLTGGSFHNLPNLQRIALDNNPLHYIDQDVFVPNEPFVSNDSKILIVSIRENDVCDLYLLVEYKTKGYIDLIYDPFHVCYSGMTGKVL